MNEKEWAAAPSLHMPKTVVEVNMLQKELAALTNVKLDVLHRKIAGLFDLDEGMFVGLSPRPLENKALLEAYDEG